MLAVVLLSQHRVSSSKTVRSRVPCGARCMRHAVSTWSAVCSKPPHSQFGEGTRPHLCIDEWNRPTPVRRRLSLTQAARSKPIPTGLAPVPGTKARSLEAFPQYSVFHSWFVHSETRCQVWQGCPKDSAHLAQTDVWILVSLGEYLRTHLKDHTRYNRGPEIHGEPRRVSLPVGEAQLAGCLKVYIGRWSVAVGRRHSVTMRKASFKTLSMRRV